MFRVALGDLCIYALVIRRSTGRGECRPGYWQNGFIRPVLKHGPRSLANVQVCEWKTHMRNESDFNLLVRVLSTPVTDHVLLYEV